MSKKERKAVANGAKLMDRILPGWHNAVNLNSLDMANGAQCLLGQTFGVHAEKCLAKEMYPEEWEAAAAARRKHDENFDRYHSRYGYVIGSGGIMKGGGVKKIMDKLGLSKDPEVIAEYDDLEHVCKGHDTKCFWAEEIAERRARDASC